MSEKTVEQLIDDLMTGLEQLRCAETDGDDGAVDNWRCLVHDYKQNLIGKRARADVKWHNGKVTSMVGVIEAFDDSSVYLETDLGAVAGELESLEPE